MNPSKCLCLLTVQWWYKKFSEWNEWTVLASQGEIVGDVQWTMQDQNFIGLYFVNEF